jgi:L-ascorbate metabolism protein UlaG (beta-lactamase superfamily)
MKITLTGHATLFIESNEYKIITDPWLTHRLDRLWVHHPAIGSIDYLDQVNVIILSHHHCDHLHIPSLAMLPRAAIVIYPQSELHPIYRGSGMGHKTIPWVLRRMGFHRLYPLAPFKSVELNNTKITGFPSHVKFPELSFLVEDNDANIMICGDSLLHPATEEYFTNHKSYKLDCAFVPTHSTSPPEPLLKRAHPADYNYFLSKSQEYFANYVNTLNPKIVIPAAFGWKLDSEEEDLSWVNHTLFPFTPDLALTYLQEKLNKPGILLGPDDEFEIINHELTNLNGFYQNNSDTLLATYVDLALKPDLLINKFNPHTATYPSKNNLTIKQLINKVADEMVATPSWVESLENNKMKLLRISDDEGDHTFLIDFTSNQPIQATTLELTTHTWLHKSVLQAFFESSLLIGNSYGLWVSTDNLLTDIFHHPKYYINHVNHLLAADIDHTVMESSYA